MVRRLYKMADDEGMKDLLAYLIARGGMHQNQWAEARPGTHNEVKGQDDSG